MKSYLFSKDGNIVILTDKNSTTIGQSRLPPQIIHHTYWYYRRHGKSSILDHIFCEEHNTSYPTSNSFYEEHPKPEYNLVRNIKHIKPRRR